MEEDEYGAGGDESGGNEDYGDCLYEIDDRSLQERTTESNSTTRRSDQDSVLG